MNWPDSDPSDDEAAHDSQSASRKRSSRACDQCRKTKSKCERSADGGPCKSCALVGTACTYLGPSYKRGPPKGYIHAIEQRWHQVESLLGAVIQCPDPKVQSIVSDMRKDDLAREIISRVDAGPFGASGRIHQPAGATKEDLFASILKSNESSSSRDPARSRRQSRVSREIVSSSKDHGLSVIPTMEWQDNLSARLASSSSSMNPPSDYGRASSSTSFENPGPPSSQRRRLNATASSSSRVPDWSNMYTLDAQSDTDEFNPNLDATDGIGQLSLDENQEVRFHGNASGLPLLGRNDRTDDRNEGGIWRLPMARVWPPLKNSTVHLLQEEDVDVTMPPVELQDKFIALYFTNIHPVFPVIHKSQFLTEYNAKKHQQVVRTQRAESSPDTPLSHRQDAFSMLSPTPSPPPKPEPSQRVTKLLLLSMFSIAARLSDDEMPVPTNGQMWEAGCEYLDDARLILTKVFHRSRPSTVQSLLLLGHREFGIGSMEQAWIYIGMAIRMAIDLGLNCNSERWKIHGGDLFSPEEMQTRRQIWWACCLADRYGSVYMGRPICIREGDYDTPLPEVREEEENEPWQPLPEDPVSANYPPVPGRVMSCFCAASTLSVILGSIISMAYPVRSTTPRVSRRSMLANLEARLDQWYISLPPSLRYDSSSKRTIPPPHILFLHIRYWGAVLLLNRAFIPNWQSVEAAPRNYTLESDTVSLKAFDLAQGAASHVSSIVAACHENFNLKRASPFLSSYIFNAGIMHILTLTLRPANLQASLGLRECLTALKEMEVVWPSASRSWQLLNGVKLGFDHAATSVEQGPDRQKRGADDAFGGNSKSSDYLQREAFQTFQDAQKPVLENVNGVQDLSQRMMAHMLGLDVPGIEPSTSFYPGYEWWPRTTGGQDSPHPLSPGASSSNGMNNNNNNNNNMNNGMGTVLSPPPNGLGYNGPPAVEDWLQGNVDAGTSYAYDFSPMAQHFGN